MNSSSEILQKQSHSQNLCIITHYLPIFLEESITQLILLKDKLNYTYNDARRKVKIYLQYVYKKQEKICKTYFLKHFQNQQCFGAGRLARRTGKENEHKKGNIIPQSSKSAFVPTQRSNSFVCISEAFTVLPIKNLSKLKQY